MTGANAIEKNVPERLAQHRVATNLQCVRRKTKKLGITKHSKVWSARPGVLTLIHCFFHSVPQLGHTIDNAVLVNQLK